ncbi:hypothetical protein CWRG_02664 [Chthonomonas calidirosea]|uniref:hypothetical protein n=1 Tax=Chthonomonas calidirosea TaxID=454171 RepID=UPI0006DD41EA|nr:hypothetical protein [Chthonomonas calidirosea]CEK19926.1 hypothetical protein CWRG_02664 [Chthonomonas calidirosea]
MARGRKRDPMKELQWSLERVHEILEACDSWLRDPQTGRYDVSPRGEELWIRFREQDPETGRTLWRRATLQQLLDRCCGEEAVQTQVETIKIEDPRRLLLRATQELRQTLKTGVELAERLTDVAALEAFQAAILEELRALDEATAHRVAARIRDRLLQEPVAAGAAPVAASNASHLLGDVHREDVSLAARPLAAPSLPAARTAARGARRKAADPRAASSGQERDREPTASCLDAGPKADPAH